MACFRIEMWWMMLAIAIDNFAIFPAQDSGGSISTLVFESLQVIAYPFACGDCVPFIITP